MEILWEDFLLAERKGGKFNKGKVGKMIQVKKGMLFLKSFSGGLLWVFLKHPLDEMEIAKIRYKYQEIYF